MCVPRPGGRRLPIESVKVASSAAYRKPTHSGTRHSLIARPALVAHRRHRESHFSRQFTKTIEFAEVVLTTIQLLECPAARRNRHLSDGSGKSACNAGQAL